MLNNTSNHYVGQNNFYIHSAVQSYFPPREPGEFDSARRCDGKQSAKKLFLPSDRRAICGIEEALVDTRVKEACREVTTLVQ